MEKLLLITAVFVVAFFKANTGVVTSISDNLKDIEKTTEKEVKETLVQQYCQEYTMVTWCNNNTAVDTVCYELGNQESKDHAYQCMRENGDLWNLYNCGARDFGIYEQ